MSRDPEGLLELVRLVAPALIPRSFGWGAVAVVAGLVAWASPWSPVSLLRGDVLLGEGRAAEAALVYDRVAEVNPWATVREAALERSASTWLVELDAPREARARLEALLWYRPARGATAELLEQIGHLLQDEGDFAAAAVRFREAHDLAPQAPTAGDRLASAATAAEHGGDRRLADALWRRLGRTHPEQLARAELGRATLALHRGDVQEALASYQRASGGTFDPDLAAAAALGATVCLSRLGDVPAALAALDEVELPAGVVGPRTEALEARIDE